MAPQTPPPNKPFIIHRRKFVIALFTLVSVLVYNFYLKTFNAKAMSYGENVQFFLLKQFSILLISILTTILIRYAIKLIFERQQKKSGFRLKTKLILIFLLIGALPVLFFFYLTNDYLNNKVQNWFRPQATTTIDKSIKFLQEIKKKQQQNLKDLPGRLVPYLRAGHFEQLNLLATSWQLEESFVSGLVIYDTNGQVLNHFKNETRLSRNWTPVPLSTLRKVGDAQISMVGKDGITRELRQFMVRHTSYVLEAYADDRVLPNKDSTLLLGDLYPLQLNLGLAQTLDMNYQVNLILFVTILVLAFMWVALYISKKLLDPIEKLMQGVEKVRHGNLDAEVAVGSHDELKLLAENFNAMVRQLKQNATELKQKETLLEMANQDLSIQNQNLQSILRKLQSGALMVKATGEVDYANQALLKLIDKPSYPPQVHYTELLPAELSEIVSELKAELEKKNRDFVEHTLSVPLAGANQQLRFEAYHIMSVEENTLLVIVQNLSEQDRLLRARAWQEVAKRMAHEIKNPLTPIRISAERLNKLLVEKNFSEKQKSQGIIQVILSEVDTLKKMIDEFSSYARVPEIRPHTQDVNLCLRRAAEAIEPVKPAHIKVVLDLAENLPPLVFDAELLKRALYNMLLNALTALCHQENGCVILRSRLAANQVALQVEDNGPGIAPDLVDKIFEPYVTTKEEGSGLGLAIAQRIVFDHRGRLSVSSQPGQTIFTITLPY